MNKIITFAIFLFVSFSAISQEIEIRVNLAGYLPDLPKRALILCKNEIKNSSVILKNTAGTFEKSFPAKLKNTSPWPPFSFEYEIDFSQEKQTGKYYFTVENKKSETFKIGQYSAWQEDVVRFMQTQRCGFNAYTGKPCHQQDGLAFYGHIKDSTQIDARGGWHDAGDQLKYLITGSNATARMLQAYLMYPKGFKDVADSLAQSTSNGIPDVLDEAIWGLDWIFRLHPTANSLYHQVADDRDHRGFKLPHEDEANYGWGKNSFRPVYGATGTPQGLGKYKSKATGIANLAGRSAAAMALGYQVFKGFSEKKSYSEKCLKAAEELYEMGKKQEGYQQGNSFGAPYRYEENTWADDMEWAAAELYKCTGKKQYLEDARRYARLINTWSWMERDTASHYEMYPFVNMGHFALWQAGNKNDKKLAIDYYQKNLERIRQKANQNAYGVGHLFIWCSNNLATAVATQAILLNKMTGSHDYDDLLQNHTNWLLGLNPWGTSMITEIPEGKDSPKDVHMPFWILEKKSIKGSLTDGPLWSKIHDKMLAIKLSEPDEYAHLQPDHIKYWDDYQDYSTNEPTMDGSADMILWLAYMNSEMK